MQPIVQSVRPSRVEVLKFALPEVLHMLKQDSAPEVDEGVLADLVALHWLRQDGKGWRMTAAGEQVVDSLSRRRR